MLYSLELSIISLLLPAPICCKQHYCTPNYTSFVLPFNSSTEYICIKTLQAFGAWLSLFVLLTTAVVDAVLENDSKTDVAWMLLSDVGQTLQ